MRRREAVAWIAAVGLLSLVASTAVAQDGGKGARDAAAPAAPATAPEDGEAMPSGHPTTADPNPHGRAGAASSGVPGMFEPPEDVEEPDPTRPPGPSSWTSTMRTRSQCPTSR